MKFRFKVIVTLMVAYNALMLLLSLVLSWQSTVRYPMQGDLVAAGEQQLHVMDSAALKPTDNRTTIVLIHGASTSALDYSTNLYPRLSEKYRVVAFDRPGHGYSERGDTVRNADPALQARLILDALHTMNIDSVVLAGHSWAGAVVMAALLQDHEQVNVRAGILLSAATHPWEGGSAAHVEFSVKPVLGAIFRWQYIEPIGRLALTGALENAFAPEDVPENYIQNTGLTLSLRPQTYKYNALDITRLSGFLTVQAPQYPQITKPLLSIASPDDRVVPAWNHHERLLLQIPRMQSLEIPGAGHSPHHTRTGLIVDTIESFVESLEQ